MSEPITSNYPLSDAEPIDSELVLLEPAAVRCDEAPNQPWLAVAFTFIVIISYVVVSSMVVGAYAVIELKNPTGPGIEAWLEQVASNGNVLAVSTLAGVLVQIPLILTFARILNRKSAFEYLGLNLPATRTVVIWILATLAYIGIIDGITWLSGRDLVPPFMQDVYNSGSPILIWLAIVVAAPLTEELTFRGLLYRGLITTRLGLTGTALITSFAWTVMHTQYDLYALSTILVGGVLLAVARYTTNSVIPCIAMHMTMNLVATLEVAFVLS